MNQYQMNRVRTILLSFACTSLTLFAPHLFAEANRQCASSFLSPGSSVVKKTADVDSKPIKHKDTAQDFRPQNSISIFTRGKNLLGIYFPKQRENKIRGELKRFSKGWRNYMKASEELVRFMRAEALEVDYEYYNFEKGENLDVYIIRRAEQWGLIKEDGQEAYIDLPIGLKIPLIKLKGRGVETLLKNEYGDTYYMKYKLDYERIEAMFEDLTFAGLRLTRRRIGGKEEAVWQEAFIWAALHDKSQTKISDIQRARDYVIERAIRLESMATGLDEMEIREKYDIGKLVRKWLRVSDIELTEEQSDVTSVGPLAIPQIQMPALTSGNDAVLRDL